MFISNVTSYSVTYDTSVKSINVNAVLTDSNAYFVEGFGPRTVELHEGLNSIAIKVRSQSGKLLTYTINAVVHSDTQNEQVCNSDIDSLALLKSLRIFNLSTDKKAPELNFDPNVFSYSVNVPYEFLNVDVEAFAQTDGDIIKIQNVDILQENIEAEITIDVTSREFSNVVKTYKILVTRQPEHVASSNAELSNVLIEGHDEFKFEQNTIEYGLKLKKKEKSLKITYEVEDSGTICEIVGNENLKKGSIINLVCTAEDGINTVEYQFQITEVAKGTNVFLVALLIILIIGVLVYVVLRLLGYKIYFNFSVIGAFFRSIGEKIKNIFNK